MLVFSLGDQLDTQEKVLSGHWYRSVGSRREVRAGEIIWGVVSTEAAFGADVVSR